MQQGDLASAFHVRVGLTSTSINSLCDRRIFFLLHQVSLPPGEFPSNSVKILCCWERFCQFPSTFRMARRLSINFCQIFVRPADLPSTSIRFSCSSCNLRQYFEQPGDVLLISVNILYGWETFHQILSILRVAGRPSVNFPCCWENFRQLSGRQGDLSSTFVIFPCYQETFCQLFVSPEDNFMSDRETFRQFTPAFREGRRPFVIILFGRETLHQLQSTSHARVGPSVNFS